ncbi:MULTISPECIES: dipeptidase [unclassified Fusibacter]|uniref:dipeptidase n=1 Tax=unclassified Fusibacter TaxID=2624464 RepID=UPI001011E1C4|nr:MULTISPECIES: dipeptidase [unclassified Fusibacter]MCK8060600.1 dipeptidase [Fusibacter sp. A2]NPE22946.1 membrane dipeptidase [Fusibacter sp. A1]RXV60013.1 membrane dipeptidase [Fusibacter sp. A1]
MKYIDLHCDAIMKAYYKGYSYERNEGHVDLEKLISSGCLMQFYAVFFSLENVPSAFEHYQKMSNHFLAFLKDREDIGLVRNYGDINPNRVNAVLTVEEGGVLEGNIDHLKTLYEDGVRSITLTWNYENEIGYPSSKFIHSDKGLKKFGKEVVEAMNEYGMIIDVSHLSDQGTKEVCKLSKQPIIASHSNSRALTHHERNLTDELIRDIANTGGLVGLNFYPQFVTGTDHMELKALVRHADHIRNQGGIDTLAIGSDFDGIGGNLDIKDASQMYKLADELKKSGFSRNEIEKVFHKNALRVFYEVVG